MSAIDRDFAMALVTRAHDVQESEALLAFDNGARSEGLLAETRSYTAALLIGAIDSGLLEMLHDSGDQFLLAVATAGYNAAWSAFLEGNAPAPELASPAIPFTNDVPAGGVL